MAGDRKKYDVIWYEAPNNMAGVSTWRKHVIYRNSSHGVYHVEVGDIDDDGDEALDIAVSAAGSDVFLLYFNNLIKGGERQ